MIIVAVITIFTNFILSVNSCSNMYPKTFGGKIDQTQLLDIDVSFSKNAIFGCGQTFDDMVCSTASAGETTDNPLIVSMSINSQTINWAVVDRFSS